MTAAETSPTPLIAKSLSAWGTLYSSCAINPSNDCFCSRMISYCANRFINAAVAASLPVVRPIDVAAACTSSFAFFRLLRFRFSCQTDRTLSAPAATIFAGVGRCFSVVIAVLALQSLKTLLNSGKRMSSQRITWLLMLMSCSCNRSRSQTASRSSWYRSVGRYTSRNRPSLTNMAMVFGSLLSLLVWLLSSSSRLHLTWNGLTIPSLYPLPCR